MKAQSSLYQAARDTEGKYSCYIKHYNTSTRMVVSFSGPYAKENRDKFVSENCFGYFTTKLTDNSLQIELGE